MQITARGWRRIASTTTVFDVDLAEDTFEADGLANSYDTDTTYFKKKANGDLLLRRGPADLRLGGQFLISIVLTKEDVLRLYAETIKDCDAAEIAKQVADFIG